MTYLSNLLLVFTIIIGTNSTFATPGEIEPQKGALKFSFLRLCDDEVSQINVQKIKDTLAQIDGLPLNDAASITYDALISIGVFAPKIDEWFQKNKITIPESSYFRFGTKTVTWYSGLRGSWNANKLAFSNNWQGWILNNRAFLLSTLAIIDFVGSIPAAAAASTCDAPNGSYRDTCTIRSAEEYRSSDPNLKEVPMCRFKVDCRKLDGTSQQQTVYLPKADVQCLKYRENCDGHLVMRSGNERLCTTPEAIKQQVNQLKKEL